MSASTFELRLANKKRQLNQRLEQLRDNPSYAKYLKAEQGERPEQNEPPKCDDKYANKLQYFESLGMDSKTLEIAAKAYENLSSYAPVKKKKTRQQGNVMTKERDAATTSSLDVEEGATGSSGEGKAKYCESSDESSNNDGMGSNQSDIDGSLSDNTDGSLSDKVDSDSSSEFEDQDEDAFELDKEENDHYRTSLNQSNLFMKLQGFKSIEARAQAGLQNEATPALNEEIDFVEYEGKTYHRGSNYEYKEKLIGGKRAVTIVGIHSFVGNSRAKCVEITKFEDTFLGVVTTEIENKEHLNFDLSDFPRYVQVLNKLSRYFTLHLSDFVGPFQELQSMPEVIYEAQTDVDKWESFAYYLDECETNRRCGIRSSAPTINEYFAGAGGSHEAYKSRGFKTNCLVEKSSVAVQSLEANNMEEKDNIYHGSVEEALNEHAHNATPLDASHFSPPCCGFSTANRYGGANDKTNNDLSLLFVTMLRVDKPKVACFENVMGMWRRKHIHYLLNIIAGTWKEGYQIRCSKLNTADYGDPQSRNRLFLLTAKNGLPLPDFPPKRYGPKPLRAIVTVGDVMTKIGYHRSHDNGTDTTPGPGGETRLSLNNPAPTIIAQGRQPLHPVEDRRISVQDMLMLMSLPRCFVVKGSSGERRRQVGNMIPFKTMSAIAEEMRSVFEFRYEE